MFVCYWKSLQKGGWGWGWGMWPWNFGCPGGGEETGKSEERNFVPGKEKSLGKEGRRTAGS